MDTPLDKGPGQDDGVCDNMYICTGICLDVDVESFSVLIFLVPILYWEFLGCFVFCLSFTTFFHSVLGCISSSSCFGRFLRSSVFQLPGRAA